MPSPRYFVAKCGSVESLRRCVTTKKWASKERVFPPQPHDVLAAAVAQGPVVLIFSVNNCHGWHGYCCMTSAPADSLQCESTLHQESVSNEKLVTEKESNSPSRHCEGDGRTQEHRCNTKNSKGTGNVQCEAASADTESTCLTQTETSARKSGISDSVWKTSSTPNTSNVSKSFEDSNPETLGANQNVTDGESKLSENWHYFTVEWQTEFISSFGETCLPSTKTSDLLLTDGSPLNKARNWQEVSADTGAKVCSLLDEMYKGLVEKRRKAEEAKLAAKPPPFIRMEGDVQEEAEQYWRCIVEKVERELGRVHLACPFGSQRYNVQQPDSDIDAFIVYQAHTQDLLGFDPPKMTIKNSDREKCDYTVLELKRYCELLLAYDARCIETLFLHDSTIIQASCDWRQLQQNRQQFLTRKCLDKYLSDALGSNGVQKLQRTVENSTLKGYQQPPPRVCKLIYIIVRLLQNAVDIVRGRPLNVFRLAGTEERNTLLRIRQGDITLDEVNAVIQRLQDEINERKDSVIEQQSNTKKDLESWLLALRFEDFQTHHLSVKD